MNFFVYFHEQGPNLGGLTVFCEGDALYTKSIIVFQGDRVMLGNNYVFRFHDYRERAADSYDASTFMDFAGALEEMQLAMDAKYRLIIIYRLK